MRVSRAATRPMINPRGRSSPLSSSSASPGSGQSCKPRTKSCYSGERNRRLEATVANLLSPGSACCSAPMVVSELWSRMAAAFGADVVRLSAPWGRRSMLTRSSVCCRGRQDQQGLRHAQRNEHRVLSDMAAIAEVVKSAGRLLAVDSVSGVRVMRCRLTNLARRRCHRVTERVAGAAGLTMIAVSDAAFVRRPRRNAPGGTSTSCARRPARAKASCNRRHHSRSCTHSKRDWR